MTWKLIWRDLFRSWPDGPTSDSEGWAKSGGTSPTIARDDEKVFTDDYSVKLHQGSGGGGETEFTMYVYAGGGIEAGFELSPHAHTGVHYNWMKTSALLNSGVTDAPAVFEVWINGALKDTITISTGETTAEHYLGEPIDLAGTDEIVWKCVSIGTGVTAVTISVWDVPAAHLLYSTVVSYDFKKGDRIKLIGAVNTAVASACYMKLYCPYVNYTDQHAGDGEWIELEVIAPFLENRESVEITFLISALKPGDYWLDDVRLYIERGRGPRCIEFFEQDYEELKDCFYVDSGLTYDGEPATEITGLIHLVGKEVAVLADGEDVGNMMVEEVTNAQGDVLDGKITLAREASVVHVGLPFKTILETLDIEQPTAEGQTSQGKQQRVHKAVVRLLNSLGLYIGSGPSKLEHWPAPKTQLDTPPTLQSGLKEVLFRGGWTVGARVWLETDRPYPLKVLSIIAKAATHDS